MGETHILFIPFDHMQHGLTTRARKNRRHCFFFLCLPRCCQPAHPPASCMFELPDCMLVCTCIIGEAPALFSHSN
jgi:hypothetical protein